jgi:hypothetical protein
MERKETDNDNNGCRFPPEFPDRGRRWSMSLVRLHGRSRAWTKYTWVCTEYQEHTLSNIEEFSIQYILVYQYSY